MVGGVELLAVFRGGLLHLALIGESRGVGLAHGGELGGLRPGVDAAATTVVADAVHGLLAIVAVVVVDVVTIVVAAAAYVGDGAVVVKVIAVPVAAEVADADVAEAVVNATVVADVGTPVAGIEAVETVDEAPVGRCPEGAVVGREGPCAGDPVVAVRTPGPVAGCPEVVGTRCGGLVVIGQRGRGLVGLVDGLLVVVGRVLVVVTLIVGVLVVIALIVGVLVVITLIVVALIVIALVVGVLAVGILIAIGVDDGRRGLLVLVRLALLLRGVGGIGAEYLGGWCGGVNRGEIGLGGVGAVVLAVIEGGGGGCVAGTALAAHAAEGRKDDKGGKAEHACEGMCRHGVRAPGAKKFPCWLAVWSMRCVELGLGVC